MERLALRQAETQIWETIQSAAPMCEAVRLVNPWNKLAGSVDYPIGRLGQGLLSWIPEHRLQKIRSVSSGLIQRDQLQLQLIHSPAAPAPIAVDLTLLVRSTWSRAGIPLSEAMQWPGGVILGRNEADEVLPYEVDYYGLWLLDQGRGTGRLLVFTAADHRRMQIETLGDRLRSPDFQDTYLNYRALDGKDLRHSKSFSTFSPPARMTLVPSKVDATRLPRYTTRLFPEHWVLEVLNHDNPIPNLTTEMPWAPSPTSQSSEPESRQDSTDPD